jgi:hypothetical protein
MTFFVPDGPSPARNGESLRTRRAGAGSNDKDAWASPSLPCHCYAITPPSPAAYSLRLLHLQNGDNLERLIKSGYHFLIIIHLKNLTYALFLDINFDWWKQAERLTLNPV